MGTTPIFVATPNVGAAQILPADTTDKKTVFTAGANGSRIESIFVASNDTSANKVNFFLNRSGVDHFLGFIAIAAADGSNPYQTASFLTQMEWADPLDKGLVLLDGDILKAAANATVTAAKETHVIAVGGDY